MMLFLLGLFRLYCSELSCAYTDQGSGFWERSAEERSWLSGFFLRTMKFGMIKWLQASKVTRLSFFSLIING